MNTPAPTNIAARLWDLPTRLFHWTLVVLIALQYATGEFDLLDLRWHFWFGYATLALVLFRILWGLFGSQTSRFSHFVRGPSAVVAYVRALFAPAKEPAVGHNPVGGWSVLALLACVLVQAASGLFASDGIDNDGPLAARVSAATVKLMTRVHHWTQNVLLLLIAMHVAAALLYLLVGRENLIAPMISGKKPLAQPPALMFASGWKALMCLAVAVAAVALLLGLGG
ncbi:MAG TPA: cytochrome b/b6 domain-containing protein [Rudaea sp.]